MSNVNLIIEERPARIGSFLVGRLLPFREKRMVGPFAFIDHMGPAELGPDENFDVPPHPHIGLSTLTYLFEGSIMHRDSLGSSVEIKPGQVNWMTSGKGIVHSERTPEHLRPFPKKLHGLQIWVALPKHLEDMAPSFAHVEAADLPSWTQDEVEFRLIAGEAFGRKSAVPVYSDLYLIEIKASKDTQLDLSGKLKGESGLYILEGKVSASGHGFGPKQLLVSTEPETCGFFMSAGTTVYLFGGEPFPEERFIYWNFVASEKETIEKAKQNWRDQTFDKIDGETEFVPLPER
ncbi:pirin family protein [Flavobacterium silvaticum]|uniref:Pirin family protein n=1 Tax=Flavobacterium silvaticum TaxID=1852020 RepID=A0A972JH85_9FLAO|nr:pirin family protein [Flavobacterium silvaticum]NMH28976.1 pirin family protein [Flavobacterium silvaticum]